MVKYGDNNWKSLFIIRIIHLTLILSYTKNWRSIAFAGYRKQNLITLGYLKNLKEGHRLPKHKTIHSFHQTSLTMIHNSETFTKIQTPPKARRDEESKVYAGNDPNTTFIRQSVNSKNKLVDPAFPISSPYGWMRDESRKNKEVLDHLTLENDYTLSLTSHLNSFKDTLYKEMISTLQETDFTVPVSRGKKYLYYTRSMEGMSYPIYCRAPTNPNDDDTEIIASKIKKWDGSKDSIILEGEEIYLDVNEIAKGHDFCSTGSVRISPSHTKLAYTLDVVGGETYQLYIKDLHSGTVFNPKEEIDSTVIWGMEDSTIFYRKMDAAHRPYQVYKKTLDSDAEDELLFEENDELFWVFMYKSQDGKYLFISSKSKETSEIHYISLENNSSGDTKTDMHVIAPRRAKVLYFVEHHHDQFYITSNVGSTPNMRLMKSPVQPNCQDLWEDVIWNDSSLFTGGYERSIASITPFTNHLVVEGRENSLPRVWILTLKNDHIVTSFDTLTFSEGANSVRLGQNYIYDTDKVLISYNSLVTPNQNIFIEMNDPNNHEKRIILKQKNVPGYNPNLYACERSTVLSRDGNTLIPVSIVYRKDVFNNNTPVPTHLYGYGSYGSCIEADFRATRLPLLNRGIVYVIAHVRGGGEMGRQWYEEPNGGKYLCKKNTFHDFIDVAQWLISDKGKGITTPAMLSCEGRSAGGLLIGASINMAPELFRVAVLGVPFVDVACTMIDSTIPLTIVEWEEWGNPNEEKFMEYILSYSPMENVKKDAIYPSCLLTGGLHDPRVQYWEPAKFAASLRHDQSGESGPVCLKIDMTAGHFSASDRYKYLKELSFDYAFLLDQLGLAST